VRKHQFQTLKVPSFRSILRALSGVAKPNLNMAWRCSGNTNIELIDNLFKNDLIKSIRVRDAMMKVHIVPLTPLPFIVPIAEHLQEENEDADKFANRSTAPTIAPIFHMPTKTHPSPSAMGRRFPHHTCMPRLPNPSSHS